MKTLIFGGTGMLGHKLVQVLDGPLEVWTTIRGTFTAIESFGLFDRNRTIENIDVRDPESVRRVIETVKPDVVVNAVGIIKQVPSSKDIVQNLTINAVFPQRLAELSDYCGFRLITIGTDCVFDGKKGNYSEDDPADARDIYGLSKLLGEVAGDKSLTIRTSIIGRELATGHSMVEWFLANRGRTINGYVNAIYSGIPTVVLAGIIADLVVKHRSLSGIYHVSSDPISKFELLELLNKSYNANVTIEPFEDYVIDRSLNSSKFRQATGFEPEGWETMIDRMASDSTPYDQFHRGNK